LIILSSVRSDFIPPLPRTNLIFPFLVGFIYGSRRVQFPDLCRQDSQGHSPALMLRPHINPNLNLCRPVPGYYTTVCSVPMLAPRSCTPRSLDFHIFHIQVRQGFLQVQNSHSDRGSMHPAFPFGWGRSLPSMTPSLLVEQSNRFFIT
jgi:hypothetical protein